MTAPLEDRALPREMKPEVYAVTYAEEETHWWFVGRRKVLEQFVEEALAGAKRNGAPPRILDVGCGTGKNLELLARFGRAEGVDISTDALEFCKARGLTAVTQGEAERLPFDDGTFDLVTALDVVEHLDDDVAGLREIHRVLKPGGRALLFVPAFMFLWGHQDDISHHRRRYTDGQLQERAREAGFTIHRTTYANLAFFLPILAGRWVLRLTGLKPASEANINVRALNGAFGQLFGAERHWLKRHRFPLGVSLIAVLEKAP